MSDQDCGVINGCSAPKCLSNGQCSTVPVDGGVICRSALGLCDVEERCSGLSTLCPGDNLRTTVCNSAVLPCESDAVCDGGNVLCPPKPLRPAGAVCSSPACLPAITCSGASTFCTGPADAGPLCDDRNVCSVDTCAGGLSCTYAVEPNITSRALLTTFADAGVFRLPFPQAVLSINAGSGSDTLTMCPSGTNFFSTPPECVFEVSLAGMAFTTNRQTGQFTGSGTALVRAQRLSMRFDALLFGTSTGGALLGLGGCGGALPAQPVAPAPVMPVTYGFRIDELDGGLLMLLPLTNQASALSSLTQTCLPSNLSVFQSAIEAQVAALVGTTANTLLNNALTTSLMEQLCLRPSDAGVCQYGTNTAGLCKSGASCYSARHFRNVVPTIPACLR